MTDYYCVPIWKYEEVESAERKIKEAEKMKKDIEKSLNIKSLKVKWSIRNYSLQHDCLEKKRIFLSFILSTLSPYLLYST